MLIKQVYDEFKQFANLDAKKDVRELVENHQYVSNWWEISMLITDLLR